MWSYWDVVFNENYSIPPYYIFVFLLLLEVCLPNGRLLFGLTGMWSSMKIIQMFKLVRHIAIPFKKVMKYPVKHSVPSIVDSRTLQFTGVTMD